MKRIAIFMLVFRLIGAQETGSTAVASTEIAQSNDWKNWTFVAIALVAAASAVYVISLDTGHSVESTTP
jgi:hypothetical protein